MSTEQLKELRAVTDRAIETVRASWTGCRNQVTVNWADLRCTEAAWIVTDFGGDGRVQVTVEEASPEVSLFRDAVSAALAQSGWPDVSVLTEW
jgi:hypothetical protein